MKKHFKLLFFALMLVTLVVTMVVIASAETSTTKGSNAYQLTSGGETVYAATLAEAVEAAEAGDTITLLKSVTETAAVVIDKDLTIVGTADAEITIHKTGGCWIQVEAGATLEVNGLTAKWDSTLTEKLGSLFRVLGTATFKGSVFSNGKVDATSTVFNNYGDGSTINVINCTADGYKVFWVNNSNSTLNIDGGTYVLSGTANETIPVYVNSGTGSVVNIYGGTFTGVRAAVRFVNGTDNVLNIYGGEFSHTGTSGTGTAGTIHFRMASGGTLNMYGGTLRPIYYYAIGFGYNDSGITEPYQNNGIANIYGGTIVAGEKSTLGFKNVIGSTVNFANADGTTYTHTKYDGTTYRVTPTGATLQINSGTLFSECVEGNTIHLGDGLKIKLSDEGALGTNTMATITVGAIEYYAYNGHFPDLDVYASALWSSTAFYIHPVASLPAGTYTLESLSQAKELAMLHDTSVTDWGGTYKSVNPFSDVEPKLIVGEGVDLNVSSGTYEIKDTFVLLKGGSVTVTGGEFTTTGEGIAFRLWRGDLAIQGGAFNCYSACMIEVAGEKDVDSVVITGGTFRLLEGDSAGGSIIRTGAAVNPQHDVNQFFDPFDVYRLSSVDILLSGGLLIDDRTTNNRVIDATLGTSRVIIDGAVLLSKNRKGYFVDANDTIDADILFSADAPVCKYNGTTYYYYTATKAGTYAPEMEKGAAVALASTYEGIRFTSRIPAAVVSKLSGKTYTFGTLIAPADYVARAGGFTHALLTELAEELAAAGESVTTFVDIEAVNSKVTNEDGSISFNGALVSLKVGNYTRNLAAVSYVLVNGKYYYSEYDSVDNARSMAYVAKEAYTTVGAPGGVYRFASYYNTSKHSAYTPTEQQRLLVYSKYEHTITSATFTPSTNITVGEDAGANLKAAATALGATLSGLGYNAEGYPILIGNTAAAETTEALSEIEGHGYYIGVINGKLVIVGTTNVLTMQALSVFESVHLAGREENGTVILWEDIVSNKKMVTLGADTTFVFSHTRDGNILDPYMYLGQLNNVEANTIIDFNAGKNHLYNYEKNPDAVDYPVVAALEMGKAIDHSGYNYRYLPDNLTEGLYGIYVGTTEKAHEAFLKGKDVGYYGYAIENGNVIVSSFDDATLRLAKKMFLDDLSDFAANGTYMIPVDYTFEKGVNYGYEANGFENYTDNATVQAGADRLAAELALLATDFPRPEGLQLSDAVTAGDNALELIYKNATYANYQEYCALLRGEGYKVYMDSREAVSNAFVTYYNETTNVMIHVMYNAYPYAERETLYTGRPLSEMFTPTLRVISAKVDGVSISLLPEEFLRINTFEKKTDAKLTVVQIKRFGYCYLYTLEDGRFVVLDGGKTDDDAMANLYNVLTELHTEIHGEAPTSEKPIEIAAWCLSHDHADHYGMMTYFIKKYCNEQDADGNYASTVKVDCIIANFASGDVVYNSMDAGRAVATNVGTSSWFMQDGVAIPYYKVFTGQKFFISNLELEVMYTNTDIYPWETCFHNNTSTVIRFTSHNTDGNGTVIAGSQSTSITVLGDLQGRGSMVMRAMWGDYLKSDMVAGAHHMYNGSEGELYELIDAQIVLLTTAATSTRHVSMFFTAPRGYDLEQNREILENTHWLYMIAGRAYNVKSGQYYNVTITMGQTGVAGLYEGGDEEFLAGLTNVAGGTAGAFAFGTGQINVGTAHTYKGNYLLVHRANFNVEMPPEKTPEYPPENVLVDNVASAEDVFEGDILDIDDIIAQRNATNTTALAVTVSEDD